MTSTRIRYAFWIDAEQLEGLAFVRERDGILPSEQIRRAIRTWLESKPARSDAGPPSVAPAIDGSDADPATLYHLRRHWRLLGVRDRRLFFGNVPNISGDLIPSELRVTGGMSENYATLLTLCRMLSRSGRRAFLEWADEERRAEAAHKRASTERR